MKKRYIWLGGAGLALVIIVAGMMYTAHFASAVNQSQTHICLLYTSPSPRD